MVGLFGKQTQGALGVSDGAGGEGRGEEINIKTSGG